MREDRMAAHEQRGDHADAPRTWVLWVCRPKCPGLTGQRWKPEIRVSRTGLGQHDQRLRAG